MKKILFLTDFSDISDNAFVYALHFAQIIDAEIHIVHITHIIEPEGKAYIHPLAAIHNKQLESEERRSFRKQKKKLQKIAALHSKQSISIKFDFEKGYFLKTILQDIDQQQIDFLVMGTAGANSIDKKLFGSHAENVINEINIPILAIPSKATCRELKDYVVAVMLTQDEFEILNEIAKDLSELKANLKCVHVVTSIEEQEDVNKKAAVWLRQCNLSNISLDIIINDNVNKGLLSFCHQHEIDILCVLHRNLSFFQRLFKINYSNQLLNYSDTALLIYN